MLPLPWCPIGQVIYRPLTEAVVVGFTFDVVPIPLRDTRLGNRFIVIAVVIGGGIFDALNIIGLHSD